MQTETYNLNGEKVGTIDLPEQVFAVEFNPDLAHEAYIAQLSQSRRPIAHTKIRSERRGGGAKAWAQKGTGHARQGSRRAPHWRKGGVVFGPRGIESFAKKINQKARQKAICGVLSEKLKVKKLAVYENLNLSAQKTKEIIKVFTKLPIKVGDCLYVIGAKTDKIIRATRNHPQFKAIRATNINVVDLLDYEGVIIEQSAIDTLVTQWNLK